MAQKSLTRGLDFGDDKKKDAPKKSDSKSLPAGKIALLVGCFAVCGLGIAYSMGAFEKAPPKPVFTPPPPEVQAVQEKAKQEQERLLTLPDGHPQKPIISGN